MDSQFMKEKPVFPLIASMALPMVLSMLVNSLYNIVDSFFVAQISEDALTALSLVFPMQNLVNALAIGFGIGINAVISLHLGGGNSDSANMAATQGLVLSALHGLLVTGLCIWLMPAFLGAFTSSANVLELGLEYSGIVFSFSLPLMLNLSYEKLFQAVGRMKVTMAGMLCGCVLNIILDPLLIFGPGPFPRLGIRGAALATGAGQVLTLVVYIIVYKLDPIPVRLEKKHIIPSRRMCLRLYSVGIPATLNLALPSLLISCLNGLLSLYSQSYVVVLGIYYKLQTFLYLPANGIIQGMRPVIGYNYGAGEKDRVRSIYRVTMAMCGCIMAAGTLICLLAAGPIIALFTDNPETIAAGQRALRIISAGFVVSTVSVTVSGSLEGLGKGVHSLAVSLCRYVLVIIPAAFFLCGLLGPEGVWHAFWITEVFTALISVFIYRRALAG